MDILVDKLEDFDAALRGSKTAKLYKRNLEQGRKDNKYRKSAQRNNIRRGKRAIDSRVICYHCKLPDHIAAKCTNRNQISTQAYHINPITKTNENGAHRITVMNLSKAEN